MRRQALALSLAGAAAIAILVALAMVGGPRTARLERYDERRARDLTELVNAIESHRSFTGALPESLDAVRERPSGAPPINDPETGEPYDYEVLGDDRFRICARLSAPESPPPMAGPIRTPDSRRIAIPVSDAGDGRLCWETEGARD